MTIDKYFLNLAGEYRVCSELLKRGVFATITYGSKKGADIYVIGTNRRAVVVEVNSSIINRFMTGFYQKYQSPNDEHPGFWVLYSVQQNDDEFEERFFILSHQKMAEAQAEKNSQGKNLTYEELVKQVVRGVVTSSLRMWKSMSCDGIRLFSIVMIRFNDEQRDFNNSCIGFW